MINLKMFVGAIFVAVMSASTFSWGATPNVCLLYCPSYCSLTFTDDGACTCKCSAESAKKTDVSKEAQTIKLQTNKNGITTFEQFKMPDIPIPGTLGAGSGGTSNLPGGGPAKTKHIRCTPGQGKVCPEVLIIESKPNFCPDVLCPPNFDRDAKTCRCIRRGYDEMSKINPSVKPKAAKEVVSPSPKQPATPSSGDPSTGGSGSNNPPRIK
jgi:hypothetical protein